MLNPSYLYGMHDEEGAKVVPAGGWCVALTSLSENYQGKNYAAIRSDINWIVRVNWGYGTTGTIPKRSLWQDYFYRFASWLHTVQGAQHIIIGNEPNHEQERPNGLIIEPEDYAEFFVQCWSIASVQSKTPFLLSPAAFAPYHADPIPWTHYSARVYDYIYHKGVKPGFISLHTYLRGYTPDAVYDTAQMGPPLQNTYAGFLSYLDAIQTIPEPWDSVPVHITECNEILPDGWVDQNRGVVQSAYSQIDWYNENSQRNPIQSLSLYRYPRYDKWHIEGKDKVLQDFNDAVKLAFRSPVTASGTSKVTTLIPSIQKDHQAPSSPSTGFETNIDPRIASDIRIEDNGLGGWWVEKVQWFDQQQAGGRHHIYVETLDEQGNPIAGTPFIFGWPTGATPIKSTAKRGFDAANHPFSPGRAAFHIKLVGGPRVSGLGMGAEEAAGFNPGTHTATLVQLRKGSKPVVQPKSIQPITDIEYPEPENLTMPFAADYPVTQEFGVNEEYYSRFKYNDVPLKGHNGIDFGTPVGTPILAIDDGKVIEVGNDEDGYGIYVKLSHPWGESLYAHLQRHSVFLHQIVEQGSSLGSSGNTGIGSGPHLHLGLRTFPYKRNDGWGGYKDPADFLPMGEEEPEEPTTYSNPTILAAIHQGATRYKQNYALLASLAWAESSFRPYLKDGLFQISDITWGEWSKRVGVVDRNDPLSNALVGAAYFRHLLNYYNGNYYKALYAWNWGPGNVDSGKEPPAITKEFANKVLHGRDLLTAMGVV